jgi:signal transduction histidine kinase
MKPSAKVAPDMDSIHRASARGASSSAEEGAAPLDAPISALIDAKIAGDRRIEQLAARVRDLTAQLTAAEERTRRSLAQDLHDDTGAALTAANLALARAEHWLPADTPDACADALRQARACLVEVADTCHRIVEGLHEPAFGAGVAVALAEWIAGFGARTAIHIDFSCQGDERHAPLDRLPHELAVALFRVMQEALGNVARHARAEHASVCIALDAQAVTLVVEDDGVGISPVARRRAGRFGLSGMRSRCEALGGSLRVASAKSGGTCVRARLPWSATPHRGLRAVNG